jgi:hypothetical protein
METGNMEGIEYPQKQCSYMAATLGAAKYLGYRQSEAWIYGSCGIAFFSHASKGGVCWSYPTDWKFPLCIPLLGNAGIAREPLPIPDGSVPEAVKAALRRGIPVSGENPDHEDVLVRGTGTTPDGEALEVLFLNGETHTLSWSDFDRNPEQYSLIPAADDRITVKSGLQLGVDMNRDPRRFSPDPSMYMGYEAYAAMAEWLDTEPGLDWEWGYQIQVWEECRRNAADFLREASVRLNDDRLREPLEDLARQFEIVHGELKAILNTFGKERPEGKPREYSERLRRAYEAEKKAIQGMEAVLELM